jgi:solute:Na+ symporter, SSS family
MRVFCLFLLIILSGIAGAQLHAQPEVELEAASEVVDKPVEPFVYEFAPADYYVIGAYLLLLLSMGFVVKKLCNNSKEFLIGGNKIPWWLAGGSIFMMSFSAWTFTGAAGFAYKYGILIILLFYFSGFGLLVGALFFAHRVRQTRWMTFGQIMHERFGRAGEQFYVWVQIPKMLFGGAIWLLGLAVFISVAFGVPMPVTILVTGGIILLYSTVSGTWAVMTADFLQAIVLMVLTIAVAILTLLEVGGITSLLNQLEPSQRTFTSDDHSVMWIIAYMAQIMIVFNSIMGANRYLAVRDGRNARKASLLAASLFFIGPLIWFIPPLAASFLFPDIGGLLPDLNHPADGAYVLIGLHVLPVGLAGLLVMVIFAATLSCMDSAITMNAGILSMNVYKPLFRPGASEREMFIATRIFNLLCGIIVILSAYALSKQEALNLFDLLLLLSAGVSLPLAVPCVLIFIYRRTPRWAAVVAVVLSGVFSFFGVKYGWHLAPRVFGIFFICIVVFSIARLFWSRTTEEARGTIERFYRKMETPVDTAKEVSGSEEVRHLFVVGALLIVIAIGLAGLLFFPGTAGSRPVVIGVVGGILLTGIALYRIGIRGRNCETRDQSPN